MEGFTLFIVVIVSYLIHIAVMYYVIKSAVESEYKSNQNDRIIRLLAVMAMKEGLSSDDLEKILQAGRRLKL